MHRVGGHVTVFISMIMMCVFALFCVLIESARTAGARWYLQTAAASAMDSVFSQYHARLWDSYRLLFAEYENESELEYDFLQFMEPYLEVENWYPLESVSAHVVEWKKATDGQGVYLEQEILDYMRYGIWDMEFTVDDVEQIEAQAKEAKAVQSMGERYRTYAKETLQLEKALTAISECQDEQQQHKQKCLERLRSYDGPGFRRQAEKLIRELERMPGLVGNYRNQANRLAVKLQDSRVIFQQEKESCTESVQNMLEEEILAYESYIALDGERRQEIEALEPLSEQQIRSVEEAIDRALETERIIEEWEEDEDGEGEGPDLDALWSPVQNYFQRLPISMLSFAHGIKDEEKEGWLKQVENLYHSGMLKLVVPSGCEVSKGTLEMAELPSGQNAASGVRERQASLLEHLLINEYCGRFFRCFTDDTVPDAKNHSQTAKNLEKGLAYELEYLIAGEKRDESNLSKTVQELLAVREGLNLMHILSDNEKRTEARTLAAVITGVAGITPLVLVTTFFVMSVWALGESLADVRGLLEGKKVVLWKMKEDWSLSLDQLLGMGQNGEFSSGGGQRGFTYQGWLNLLLLLENIISQEYRMMDMIQMNICRNQEGFRIKNCLYQAQIKGDFCGKHVFFSPGFVEKLTGSHGHQYMLEVLAEHTY